MNLESELATELERAVPQLPSTPAADYLSAGRRARRRRRRRAFAGAAGVAVLALMGGAALSALDDSAPSSGADSPASPGPSFDPDIPAWAQEYGNHGPISIAPSGELWIAPDARVLKTVEIPASSYPPGEVMSAYAAEAEFEGAVWRSYVVRVSDPAEGGTYGTMELAGDWTTDFDLWVDYASAHDQGRTRFSERLVRFANGSSERLVALPGAQIVDQVEDLAASPAFETHPRRSMAEVRYLGKTWFVLAEGPRSFPPFYTPYQREAVDFDDLDGFLDYLHAQVGE